MCRGAFKAMQHDHYFRAVSSNETEMKDIFRFAAPFSIIGRIACLAPLQIETAIDGRMNDSSGADLSQLPLYRVGIIRRPDSHCKRT